MNYKKNINNKKFKNKEFKNKNKKGLFFDFLIKNIVIFLLIFILAFKLFILYSPSSSDRKYQDFYLQVKQVLNLSLDFKLNLIYYNFNDISSNKEFLTNFSVLFKQYYIRDDKIIFINAFNTPCYFQNNNFIIETIADKNYIPLKVMLDIDANLDDGIPNTGKIKSNVNNYYIGCRIIINLY
jgi:hypothetical protein